MTSEKEPSPRLAAFKARQAEGWDLSERPEAKKKHNRELIRDFIDDTDPEIEAGVVSAAHNLLSSLQGEWRNNSLGCRERYPTEADRAEIIALSERMLERYGENASAMHKDARRSFDEAVVEFRRDPEETAEYVARKLRELLGVPEDFEDKAYKLLRLKAIAEGRHINEVTAEWCDGILRGPASPAAGAAVRNLRCWGMPREEIIDGMAEIATLYCDSEDPIARQYAARSAAACLSDRPEMMPVVDALLKKRDKLRADIIAELLFQKAGQSESAEEKERLYKAVLELKSPPVDDPHDREGISLASHKNRIVARMSEAIDHPETRLRFLTQAIRNGAKDPGFEYRCLSLIYRETEPSLRGPLLDEVIAIQRESNGRDSALAHLLTHKADGTRDSAAAMALYREALALYEREGPPFERALLEGMLRLTPDRKDKAALYDRFIGGTPRRGWPYDESHRWMMEKAALLGDAADREKVFATMLTKYDDYSDHSRKSMINLAEALRAWLDECAAAGRDPNDRDGASPEREGEIVEEMRQKKLATSLSELSPPPNGQISKPFSFQYSNPESYNALYTAFHSIRKFPDPQKQRTALRMIVETYGGDFNINIVNMLQTIRKALAGPDHDLFK